MTPDRDELRRQLELAIETAIALLDQLDGEPDLEPEDAADEFEDIRPRWHPSIGGPGDPEDAEDGGDSEPDPEAPWPGSRVPLPSRERVSAMIPPGGLARGQSVDTATGEIWQALAVG